MHSLARLMPGERATKMFLATCLLLLLLKCCSPSAAQPAGFYNPLIEGYGHHGEYPGAVYAQPPSHFNPPASVLRKNYGSSRSPLDAIFGRADVDRALPTFVQ